MPLANVQEIDEKITQLSMQIEQLTTRVRVLEHRPFSETYGERLPDDLREAAAEFGSPGLLNIV